MKTLSYKGVMMQLQFEHNSSNKSTQEKLLSKVDMRTADSDEVWHIVDENNPFKTILFHEGFEICWTHYLEKANGEWMSIALKGYPKEMSISSNPPYEHLNPKVNIWLIHDEFHPPILQEMPERVFLNSITNLAKNTFVFRENTMTEGVFLNPITNLAKNTFVFRENTKTVTLFRQSSTFFPKQVQGSNPHLKSWKQASSSCSAGNSTLPIILTSSELKQFVALLKFVIHIPPVEGIYLGLQYQVRMMHMFSFLIVKHVVLK